MLAKRLKELRAKNGLTQATFAEEFSISKGTIAMWETGKRTPDIETIKQIAEYFGVSVDYLVDNEKQDTSEQLKDDRIVVLARHLQEIPDEDRASLIDNLESTIDMYLKAKGLK